MLIRVHAAGVNPVDTYIRSGSYARRPTLPFSPGSDSAGVIERVGAEVTGCKVRVLLYSAQVRCVHPVRLVIVSLQLKRSLALTRNIV